MKYFAKFERKNNDLYGTTTLIEHCIDVGVVCGVLLKNTQYRKLLKVFSKSMGCSENMVYDFLVLLCSLHDIGKIHPFFQSKDIANLEYLRKNNFLTLIEYKGLKVLNKNGIEPSQYRIRHEVFSKRALKLYYKIDNEYFNNFLSVIGLHHEKYSIGDLKKEPKNNKNYWYLEYNKIIEELESVFNFSLKEVDYSKIQDIDMLCFLLLGLLELSDWIASSDYFKNSHSIYLSCSNLEEYKRKQMKRSMKIIKENIGLSEDISHLNTNYSSLFGVENVKLRGIQEEIIKVADNKKFILIEGPMGEGKTEAALYAFGKISNNYNFYFALPTSATSDGMYYRLEKIFKSQDITNLNLLHSSSFLAEKLYKEDIDDFNSFLSSSRTGLFVDNCVGTVDQIMLSVMKVKFSSLRLLGLLNKVVIIDEVHAYDCYMSEILSVFLRWANKLEIPVIMLSATLPTEKRRFLIESCTNKPYMGELTTYYPLITSIDLSNNILETKVKKVKKSKSFSYELIENKIEIYNLVKEKLDNGKNVGIVCNTIKDSQILYEEFKSFGVNNLYCLNGAKKLKDRYSVETVIIDSLGKVNRKSSMLVIGTQILEQSLDIDFDVLITAICPIDLLFQRIGRFNRFDIPNREIEPFVYVLTDDESYKKSKYIYHPLLVERTYRYIKEYKYCSLPSDFRKSIEYVYNEHTYTSEEEDILIKYLADKQINKELGKIASYLSPQISEFQRDISSNIFIDVDEDLGSYGTRLGENTLKLSLLSEEAISIIGIDKLINCKDKEIARTVLENSLSVRFSSLFASDTEIDELLKKGIFIKGSGLLKGYFLCRMKKSDENNMFAVLENQRTLVYNKNIGLQIC